MAWISTGGLIRALALGWVVAALASLAAVAQTSGGTANAEGASLEATIEAVLVEQGFEIIPARDWRQSMVYERDALRVAVTNAPYQTIYGGRSYIEFLLLMDDRQILIEAKRQSRSGSVDEKLPFVYLNALANLPDSEFVLVMDGEGWRRGARDWIEARAAETPGFTVMAPDALASWLATPLCPGADPDAACVTAPRADADPAASATTPALD